MMTESKEYTQELFEIHHNGKIEDTNASNGVVVSAHFGDMSKEDVNDIGYEIETKMRDNGAKKGVVKRVFSIVVEALQNIRLHGERTESGIQCTSVVIGEYNGKYKVSTANLIFDENVPKVEDRVSKINSLSAEELKKFYMQVLTNGEISQKGGAGLGFITIAMKSREKLDYYFTDLEAGMSMFTMSANVSPKEK